MFVSLIVLFGVSVDGFWCFCCISYLLIAVIVVVILFTFFLLFAVGYDLLFRSFISLLFVYDLAL